MSARHESVQFHEVKESLRITVGDAERTTERLAEGPSAGRGLGELVSLSAEALAAVEKGEAGLLTPSAARLEAKPARGPRGEDGDDERDGLDMDVRTSLFAMLIEHLTGRKLEVFEVDTGGEGGEGTEGGAPRSEPPPAGDGAAAPSDDGAVGWGVSYDYSETRYESERTEFSAEGVIRTADGQEIAFTATVSMSREYYESTELHLRAGDAARMKDPLVLNFDGPASALGDTHFEFDIDADGELDRLASLGSGTAMLALDKNGNGKVDDGAELFGTKSGDGYADLAAHDQDGNGWIDEGDSVFGQLKVWTRDAQGTDRLLGLREAGVGAISLGRTATPFELHGQNNVLQGAVRSMGVWLTESGQVRTSQQIDLAV